MPSFRLPELDPVALRIERPAEAAVLGIVDLLVDGDAGAAELREHGVEIADAVVHHAWLVEVLGRGGKDRPGRVAEHRAAVRRIDVDAEVVAVPVAQHGRVVRFDEDSADSSDLFHSIPFHRNVNTVAAPRETTPAA